jgi:hypothetical protein
MRFYNYEENNKYLLEDEKMPFALRMLYQI